MPYLGRRPSTPEEFCRKVAYENVPDIIIPNISNILLVPLQALRRSSIVATTSGRYCDLGMRLQLSAPFHICMMYHSNLYQEELQCREIKSDTYFTRHNSYRNDRAMDTNL